MIPLVPYLTVIWIGLLLLGAIITTLNIGKPRDPYTPGLAVVSWLIFLVAALVVTGVIR